MRRHALPLAVLAAMVLLAFGEVIGSERGLFFRDHALVFRQLLGAVAVGVRDGRAPGLTGGTWGGVPLEQSTNAAVYAPGTLVLLFGDVDVAYDWFVVFHFVVLLGGVYGFACALGATRAQAVVGAGVATLSGPFLSLENLVVALQGVAYAPWVWWALLEVLRRPRARSAAMLALATGFHVQGILPEVAVLDLLVAVALWLHLRPPGSARQIALLLGAAGLSFAVAAADLVPFLAAFGASRRGRGFDYDAASGWALGPPMFIELVAPSFWNPPDVPFINAPSITGQVGDPFYFTSVYFGAALSVAIAGLRTKRAELAVGAAVVLLVVIAMGRHAPLHRLVASLPVLRSSRYAVKYMIPAAAGVAALAALCCGRLQRAEVARRLALVAAGQATVMVVLWWSIGLPEARDLLARVLQGWGSGPHIAGVSPEAFPDIAVAAMRPRVVHGALAAGVVAVAAGVALARERWLDALPGAVAALVVLDLCTAARWTVFGADIERQRLPKEAEVLLSHGLQRYFTATPGGQLPEVAHVPGHTYFEDIVASHGKRARNPLPHARRWVDLDLDGQSNPQHVAVFEEALQTLDPGNYRIMARAGVEYLTSWAADIPEKALLSWDVPGEVPEHLYRLEDVRPYVSAFVRWRPRKGERFADPSARDVAWLPPDAREVATSTSCPPAIVRDVRRPRAERIEATVESVCPALVVAQEPLVAGWTVFVDGAPATLTTAEAGYLAVHVGAGAHEVRFSFSSLAERWFPVTVLGILFSLVVVIVDRRR